VSIFVFFGVALGITILFQISGMVIGRLLGRKYREETVEQAGEEKQADSKARIEKTKWKRKDKKQPQTSIGMERLSDETVHEGFRPVERESVMMTEVIIEDEPVGSYAPKVTIEDAFGGGLLGHEAVKSESLFIKESPQEKPVSDETKPENGAELESRLLEEWKLTHPDEMEADQKEVDQKEANQTKETDDKSFFMETSKIKIIDENDIEEYYRNKK